MHKPITSLVVLFSFLSVASALPAYYEPSNGEVFNDVYESYVYEEAIKTLKADGAITGYPDGSYKPQARINRAELVTLMMRGTDQELSGGDCFSDVKNEWFAPSVCTAKRLGYLKGYEDGTFRPTKYVNFAEASKIISVAFEGAQDENGAAWYKAYVDTLAAKKAIPLSITQAENDITRGDMAEIIWRIKHDVTDKAFQDFDLLSTDLPNAPSCDYLHDKIEQGSQGGFPQYRMMDDMVMMESDMAAPMAGNSRVGGGGATEKSFTQTNVQVQGVDEGDTVKTDGEYLYIKGEQSIQIVKVGNDMQPTAKIKTADKNVRDLYVTDGKLIVISDLYHRGDLYPVPMDEPVSSRMIWPGFRDQTTEVAIYNISDQSNPELIGTQTMDGNLISSRRVDDQLYVVTNKNVYYWQNNKNQPAPVPTVRIGNQEPEALVGCGDVRIFPGPSYQNYTTVAAIDIDNIDQKPKAAVVLAPHGSTVYANKQHLYLAAQTYGDGYYTDWDWKQDHTKTRIFRFRLNGDNIKLDDTGVVKGSLINQFSLDETRGYLRVATTTQGETMANHVWVLDANMEEVGSITDIAPGEKIYSTRFMGDRLYMVTFKTIDPLFVIDLKYPKNPKILGKLKIPGYSDYLHPYKEGFLIGFGKEATASKDGKTAWYQGMKVALFDVRDVANPKQLHEVIIGDRGTQSELLHNHKALMWDPENNLMAFPVTVHKLTDEQKQAQSENQWAWGQAEFQGAHVYKIDENSGFDLVGAPTHYDAETLLKMGDYFPQDYRQTIQRIFRIGDEIYTISPGKVEKHNMDVEEIEAVEL